MTQGPNSRRPRVGRSGGRRPFNANSSHGRTLESNGPNVKLRGTVSQICEKYQTLARDAVASGNRVSAENYFQHAEHYLRLMNGAPRPAAQPSAEPPAQNPETASPEAADVTPRVAAEPANAEAEAGSTKPEPPAN